MAKGKQKYVSKNNNNVLRLNALRRIPNSKIILLFRHPLSHASSLLKLHLKFSDEQRKDPFALEYFDYLGHHEFGLHHKPFELESSLNRGLNKFQPNEINYWLHIWLNYYNYCLQNVHEDDIIICFEDLISIPDGIYQSLSEKLSGKPKLPNIESFSPSQYHNTPVDDYLLEESLNVYKKLSLLKLD